MSAAAVGVLLLIGGLIIASSGGGSGQRNGAIPPTPPSPSVASADGGETPVGSPTKPTAHPSSSAAAGKCVQAKANGNGLGAVHLCIPSIGVSADVIPLGLNADKTIEVPTLAQVRLAGWYKYSPAPGVIGPAIILGHVDSAQYGNGVFFDLGKLHHGAVVSVERADGMIATYHIDRVAEYSKKSFPTQKVYGNTAKSTIRLITCGGTFDPVARSYEDNIVAYGTLASLKPS